MKRIVKKNRLVTSSNPIHAVVSNREVCCTHCMPWEFCSITPQWWSHDNEDIVNYCRCIMGHSGGRAGRDR